MFHNTYVLWKLIVSFFVSSDRGILAQTSLDVQNTIVWTSIMSRLVKIGLLFVCSKEQNIILFIIPSITVVFATINPPPWQPWWGSYLKVFHFPSSPVSINHLLSLESKGFVSYEHFLFLLESYQIFFYFFFIQISVHWLLKSI